jgi:prepilin-type N-terminal cleavage/methylation domain-containing protein
MISPVPAISPNNSPKKHDLTPQDTTNHYPGGIMITPISNSSLPQNAHSAAAGLRPKNSQLVTRNSQPAFTLIELLVVIGIILVLMGLFFAGAKIVTAQAKERDTKTALETCKTMFANYQQATHLSRLPPGMASVAPWNTPPGYSWTTSQEQVPQHALASTDPIVTDTAFVMYAIESLPENQKIIASLPQNKVQNVVINIVSSSAGLSPPVTVSVPLVLDGYGNPIVFVPGGGLGTTTATVSPAGSPNALVWLDGVNAGIITTTGPITNTSTPYNLTSNLYVPTKLTLANQPFFVSAGPDGDLSNSTRSDKTDDNIYSFK